MMKQRQKGSDQQDPCLADSNQQRESEQQNPSDSLMDSNQQESQQSQSSFRHTAAERIISSL